MSNNQSLAKNIFSRNVILIMLLQTLQGFNNVMCTAYLGQMGKAMGLSSAFIGIAASLYTFAGLLSRAPAGAATDSDKKRMVLVGALAARSLVFALYGFCGTSATMYMVVRFFHGVTWSFIGVALPAIMAMMVDKKVMGTAYAVFTALSSVTRSISRPWAISLYKNYGVQTVSLITAGVGVLCVLVALMLDFNDPNLRPAKVKKASMNPLEGIAWKYFPICIIAAISIICYQTDSVYTAVMADEKGLNITAALAVGALVATGASLAVGVLSDIFGAKWVAIGELLLYGAGTFAMGRATTEQGMFLAILLFDLGSKYSIPIRVLLFKICDKSETGAISATNLLCNDIFSTLAGTLVGVVGGMIGLSNTFVLCGAIPIFSALVFLFFGNKLFPTAKKEETPAQA